MSVTGSSTAGLVGHELSPQEFALAIAIFVSHRRTRISRRRRLETAFIDDCLAVLDGPVFNPKISRIGISRQTDAKRVRLCEETRAIYAAMAPVIRALEDAAA